ncbi:MAG: hypothetical protein AVDCRST_MAG57-550, partial [uncultured Blastococcus sp.]
GTTWWSTCASRSPPSPTRCCGAPSSPRRPAARTPSGRCPPDSPPGTAVPGGGAAVRQGGSHAGGRGGADPAEGGGL